jgi:hypothetical protein
MSDPKDQSLEDIISSLNSIREQLDENLRLSSSDGVNDVQGSSKPEEENESPALEDYLASRLEQIGEIAPEKREVRGLKTGNGWDASQVIEHVCKIEPVSIKRATEVACSSNRSLRERLSSAFGQRKEEPKIIGTPLVEFIPIWKVKGFHECYYLRTNSYKVDVKSDVVAVEVEGRSRDLILERRHRRFIPTAIVERFQRLASYLSSESKYFVVSDAMELATKRTESELAMTGEGKPLTSDEDTAMTSWRSKRIFDSSELKVRGARVNVREPIISKEVVLDKFRDEVVHMPERFKRILSNKLKISELKRIYVPFIRISLQKGLVPSEVIVNGTSGEIADGRLLELLE